jgi:hypothetical protein
MKHRNRTVFIGFLVSTLMVTSLTWGQYFQKPRQDGAIWEDLRLVTSRPGMYLLVQVFNNGLNCDVSDWRSDSNCSWNGVPYDSALHEDEVRQECAQADSLGRGYFCYPTAFCDSNNDNIPTEMEVLGEWYSGAQYCDYWRQGGACTCVVSHWPYIDGAKEDDILFYPTAGLDWPNATEMETRNYTVATAFFRKLWPQYGDNSPYHVAYCYHGLSYSEHNNHYLSSPREVSNELGTTDNTGDICVSVFDNRAVLNVESWDMGCDSVCWGDYIGDLGYLITKDACCCELEWIDKRSMASHGGINVAHEMMNMQGDYFTSTWKPEVLRQNFYNKAVRRWKILAGTGIRWEHNWSQVNGVFAYATNHDEIDAGELQQRRDHMGYVGRLNNYKYNFGGYTTYHEQAGCSQTMGDTLRDVGQLTTCQGYNTTHVPECVMEEMGNRLFTDFYDFCSNIAQITDKGTDFCVSKSKDQFCKKMASSILYGFMDQDYIDFDDAWSSEYNVQIPTPRDIYGVTSPADLWDRLFATPSDVCGPLRTGDPGYFSTPDRDCIDEVGERCTCPTENAYCWCYTEYDNWCPIAWYDACDGCDEGCQFLGGEPPDGNPAGDPDCFNPSCSDYDESHGKPLQCGNGRIDPGEDSENCLKDFFEGGGFYNEDQCDWDFCSPERPCGPGGGDCDTDADCADWLMCGFGNGSLFGCGLEYEYTRPHGLPWGYYSYKASDVCVRVGGRNYYGEYRCSDSFCSPGTPCLEGAGDCDSDADCVGTLRCSQDKGSLYGCPSSTDICVATYCGDGICQETNSDNLNETPSSCPEDCPAPDSTQCPCDYSVCEYCYCPGGGDEENYDDCNNYYIGVDDGCDCGCASHDPDCDSLYFPDYKMVFAWELQSSEIRRSMDNGQTFESIYVCPSVNSMRISDSGKYVFVRCSNGVYRSDDYGYSFSSERYSSIGNALKASDNGQYLVFTDLAMDGYPHNAFFSMDTGLNWITVDLAENNAGLPWISATGRYMTIADRGSDGGKFYYSTTFGNLWLDRKVAPGSNLTVGNVTISDDGQYWFVDTMDGGIYISNDYGKTFYNFNSSSEWNYSYGQMSSKTGSMGVTAFGTVGPDTVVYRDDFADSTTLPNISSFDHRYDTLISDHGNIVAVTDRISINFGQTFSQPAPNCNVTDMTHDGHTILCFDGIDGALRMSQDSGLTFSTILNVQGTWSAVTSDPNYMPEANPCVGELCLKNANSCIPNSNECGNDGCGGSHPACPSGEICDDGTCVPGSGCSSDEHCDDGIFCNGIETCVDGACVNDGNSPCTVSSYCSESNNECYECLENIHCDDRNPCTDDICSIGICENVVVPNGTSCSNSNICDGTETCEGLLCVSGTDDLDCDDDDPCTKDLCHPVDGCNNPLVEDNSPCLDDNLCDGQYCLSGTCHSGGPTPDCDDGNACTEDSCDPARGCIHTINYQTYDEGLCECSTNADCDDGLYCNGYEICNVLTCQPGVNPCAGDETCNETTDSCDPQACNDLVISNLSPSFCEIAQLDVGDEYLVDRSYVIESLPAELIGLTWIKTDASYTQNTDPDFMNFDVNQDVTVYIAFDNRATGLPSFMSGYTATGLVIEVSDSDPSMNYQVYSMNYAAGTITLGGNGGVGAGAHYVVLVEGNCSAPPPSCAYANDCDDGNVCTTDDCISGVCSNTNNTEVCDDGIFCNGADNCSGGSCSAHTGDPCSSGDTCNESTYSCDQQTCDDLMINNLSPSFCEIAQLDVGDEYLVDRTYVIESLPAELIGLTWIKTDASYTQNTDPDFMHFDVNQDVTVYIAFDNRATGLPSFMSGYTDTGLVIGVSDANMDYNVYSMSYAAGTITLGGNGGVGAGAHYVVLVEGNCSAPPPICASDFECDDGVFCNGAETCNAGTCQPGSDPCSAEDTCNESNVSCDPPSCACIVDSDCDDGLYCNGAETCDGCGCVSGSDPCTAGETCNESTYSCEAQACDDLVISNLSPSFCEIAQLDVGDEYLVDRSYVIESLPAELSGLTWIKTDASYTQNTDPDFMNFDVNQDVTIYIAFDSRASGLPSFMSGYTATGLEIEVTDSDPNMNYQVYSMNYAAGTITLGGNGGVGAGAHYVVLVERNCN